MVVVNVGNFGIRFGSVDEFRNHLTALNIIVIRRVSYSNPDSQLITSELSYAKATARRNLKTDSGNSVIKAVSEWSLCTYII